MWCKLVVPRGICKIKNLCKFIFGPTIKKTPIQVLLTGSPKGNRTPDTTVKGWCLNRLTMGPRHNSRYCQIAYAIIDFLLGYSFSPPKHCFVGTPKFLSAFYRFNKLVETSSVGKCPRCIKWQLKVSP